uniref:Uncharacterized protein n=1 Tax=Arundo donax TaxID=35708 RepID=A0A0A9FGB6_ARUDO
MASGPTSSISRTDVGTPDHSCSTSATDC